MTVRIREALLALGIGALTPLVFEIGLLARRVGGDAAGLVIVPLLSAASIHALWFRALKRDATASAAAVGLLWALGSSIATIALVALSGDGERYTGVILRAEEYRTEMFEWIRTGVGPESEPSRFLPQHAMHFAAFAVLTGLSFGYLGLALGAALLHYMNFYVGSLVRHAGEPLLVALVGWPPYAIVRVIGYVLVASALTGFAVARFRGVAIDGARARRCLWVGLALVVADVAIKSIVAPSWGRLLAGWVDLP